MEYAVNYSPPLAGLVEAGLVRIDRFKCPAWPSLLEEAQKTLPVYIHFPLAVGYGQGEVMDEETHQPADLDRVAKMIEQTGTPFINAHFIAPVNSYPGMQIDSDKKGDIHRVVDGALRDLKPLIQRFGAENILVENIINEFGWLTACALPQAMHMLLEESGCGFLFDLSHARITAGNIGIPYREYIAGLPLDRLKEVHVTGLQVLEGELLQTILAIGDPYGMAANLAGKRIDHLPMLDEDWSEMVWAMGEISAGRWSSPWVTAFEYGGVGAFWEAMTSQTVYLEQLPRMAELIRSTDSDGRNHV